MKASGILCWLLFITVVSVAGEESVITRPLILKSTLIGSDGRESATSMAIGPQGEVYLAGWIFGGTLDTGGAKLIEHRPAPPFEEPFPGFFNGSGDIFVIKYAPDLSSVDYYAIIGGYDRDEALAIAVDAQGCAVVLAHTRSEDFPTKAPIQTNLRGENDAAILKLSPNGEELLYSTFLGGSGVEFDFGFTQIRHAGLAVGENGEVTVAGTTYSQDFPTTNNAFQRSSGGGADGFVAKLSADGTELIYATYIGGEGEDLCQGLAVDSVGNATIAGSTRSSDFPLERPLNDVRQTASQREPFLARLHSDGGALKFSTYLMGQGTVNALILTESGSVVLAGQSTGGLPMPANALQPIASEATHGFMLEINPSVSAIAYASYLGGQRDHAHALASDTRGNLVVLGSTSSERFVTRNGFPNENPGLLFSQDAFIVKLDASRNVIYSTRFGGLGVESGRAVTLDSNGNILLAGQTESFDFPLVNATRNNPIGPEAFMAQIADSDASVGGGNQQDPPAIGPFEAKNFTDRDAKNFPERFYRIRELRH